tara:strand:- start:64 stop:318 length:255 start_codon:yes stop_codon:yes gene_type:complete
VIDIFAEYGVIGVMVMLFAGQMVFLQKALMGKLNEIEEISIKLIDRWNTSDERAERRHDRFVDELNDITDEINFIKGRLNGRSN